MFTSVDKLLAAIAGTIVPILQGLGVDLPGFLNEQWLAQLTLVLTPLIVWLFPNKSRDGKNASPSVAILFGSVLAISFGLYGCGSLPSRADSVSDAIVLASATVQAVADETLQACGNTQPGGDCAPGAVITSSQRDSIKSQLQTAQDAIITANRLLVAGDSDAANQRLMQANIILQAISDQLRQRSSA